MTIAVDHATLGLSCGLLRRQADHAEAMCTYARRECCLGGRELGWLLGAFHPLSEVVVKDAGQGVRGLRSIAVHGADALDATTATYVETDRQAHTQLARLATMLGMSVPDFHDPRGRQLTLRLGARLGEERRDAEQEAEQLDAAAPGSADPFSSTRRALDDLQTRADAVRRHLGDR